MDTRTKQKKEAIKLFKKMLPELKEEIIKDAEKLLDSGGIDFEWYENDYRLPKILMRTILERQSWQYTPLTKTDKKAYKNILHLS